MADGDPVEARLERSVEAQLRAARERGEFDNLPGQGKPLPNLDGDHDEMWWIRQWLRRENLSFTPPALAVRKSVEDMLNGLDKLLTERAVRTVVEQLNKEIRDLNRMPPVDGPPTTLFPLDVEDVVTRWRALRSIAAEETVPMESERDVADPDHDGRLLPRTTSQWVALLAAVGVLAAVLGFAVGRQTESHPSATSVDGGFLIDMIDHHDQAVQMSLLETRNGATPEIQHFAHEILRQQSVEIGLMTERLNEWGLERRADVGTAMKWMDHASPSDAMPGMATPAQMKALGVARGREADALFIRLMRAHHEGGADMAQYAAEHASDLWVRDLAGRMARVQRQEIGEMEVARKRFDLPQ